MSSQVNFAAMTSIRLVYQARQAVAMNGLDAFAPKFKLPRYLKGHENLFMTL